MTGSQLARYDGPRDLTQLRQYATLLAGGPHSDNPPGIANGALPKAFRGNPAALAFAVEYAKALDVPPVTAITGIHVVDGKPTASAGLISALVRRAGHQLRIATEGSYETGDLAATATITRQDDPEFTYTSRWDLDRAARAGLLKLEGGRYRAAKPQSAWDHYPEGMLKARAITEVGRDAAEDALMGIHYTPEELGADVDAAGEPVDPAPPTDIVDAVIVEDPKPEPEQPAPQPEPGPTEPIAGLEVTLDAAAASFAEDALNAAHPDDLRHLYRQAQKEDLLSRNVTDELTPTDKLNLAAPEKVYLGGLLMACNKWVTEHGYAVRDTVADAAAQPPTDAVVHPPDVDPWADAQEALGDQLPPGR